LRGLQVGVMVHIYEVAVDEVASIIECTYLEILFWLRSQIEAVYGTRMMSNVKPVRSVSFIPLFSENIKIPTSLKLVNIKSYQMIGF